MGIRATSSTCPWRLFEVPGGVHSDDAGDLGVGVLVADDHVTTDRDSHTGSYVDRSGPRVAVGWQIHEIDGDLVVIVHGEPSSVVALGVRYGCWR